tara:strand:+ start:659 stop:859 length:201 start_codon:yes stop_codon:yes gene_type:complete
MQAWTIEAWVRYTGAGTTYGNICGTDDEGLGLPIGMRGGWNFLLSSGPKKRYCSIWSLHRLASAQG